MAKKAAKPKAVAAAAAPTGVPRPGLTCKSFSLELKQNFKVSGTATTITDDFRLIAFDGSGDRYLLAPATISDAEALVVSILQRIAAAKAKVGWKFDAVFYPQIGSGIITG